MRIADFSVERPVAIVMIVVALLILGLYSLFFLSVDLLPDIESPVISIKASYPGAGPEEVENDVARVLESGLGTVKNVTGISTACDVESITVTINFAWGTDMGAALADVRANIDQVKRLLPDDVTDIVANQVDYNAMPILRLGVTGDQDPGTLKKLVDDEIKPRLEKIDGVATVTARGGLDREIQVLVDPQRLQHYDLTVSQISQLLESENVDVAGGTIPESHKDYILRGLGKYKSAADLGGLPLQLSQGGSIHLRDIADTKDTYARQDSYALLDGKQAVAIYVQKQSGANTVDVAKRVKAELAVMEKELTGHIRFGLTNDQSYTISQSINQVSKDTVLGGLLAVLVLLLFLRNVRTTLVITLAIPFAVITTFMLLYFNKMTLNLMSLGGLSLGLGHMVDYAIVVIESIFRYRSQGYGPKEAAKAGTAEVGGAVVASAITVAAVFLPMIFVQGLAGQIFKQFALTVAFSQLSALFVSLTLVPMLASKILKSAEDAGEGKYWWSKLARGIGKRYDKLDGSYRKALKWSLGRRMFVSVIAVLLLFGSVLIIPLIGTTFMPAEDTGQINIDVQLPAGTRLNETGSVMSGIEKKVKELPEVISTLTNVGGGKGVYGTAQAELGQMAIRLKPQDERNKTTEQVMELIRNKIKGIPGAKVRVAIFGGMSTLSKSFSGRPIELTIRGNDLEQLKQVAKQVQKQVAGVSGTRQITSSIEGGRPELRLQLNREKLSHYGLSAGQVASLLKISGDGKVITSLDDHGTAVNIRLLLSEQSRFDIKSLENLTVSATGGIQVPITEVADFIRAEGPNTIYRDSQSRVAYIYGDYSGRGLGEIMTDIENKVSALKLPPGYTVRYGGQSQDMAESFKSLGIAMILALLMIYMVMAGQFESLLYPFVIMFSVPVSVTGVVLSLILTGRDFSVPAYIGIIMMVGIVVNNAIVLIDYVNTLKKQGLPRDEAIVEAGPVRLRPILMTALATIFGLIPLALGLGEGSETQAPMATVVIGGLLVSTLLTLIIVPVVYTLFDDLGQKLFKRFAGNTRKSNNVLAEEQAGDK